ncbi:MAG TPA: hypothetical protein VLL51_04860 [Gemmatimonadales bacterium]|nr:hypothetical protein [Gemmatimonadales bacterium]
MTMARTMWLPLALVLAAAPAAAQAPGLPIRGGGVLPGVEIGATVGFTGEDSRTGDGTAFAASLAWGTGRFGLTGTAGVMDRSAGGSDLTLGALAAFRIIGDQLQTFALTAFGGYGYFEQPDYDPETLAQFAPPGPGEFGSGYFPVGLDFSLTIPTPVLTIRPWLSPRYEFESVDRGAANSSEATFAGSAGVDLRFVKGFGLRVMWDKADGRDQTIGLSAAYHF